MLFSLHFPNSCSDFNVPCPAFVTVAYNEQNCCYYFVYRELALLNARSVPILGRQREVDLERIHYPHVYDSRAEAMKTSAFIGGAKVCV